MKSLKKTLVLLVVFSMILSTLVPAFAFSDVEDGSVYEDQITRMAALGIINGYAEDGTFRPDETVTRAQMVKIICMMLGLDEGDAKGSENIGSKFSDVSAGHWANGWINVAANKGIVNGYPDGTFRPDAPLTLNEVLTLCVKALGRGGYVDQMGAWPGNYLTEAARLQLKADVENVTDANRGTVAVIAWNTLNTPTWYVKGENLEGDVSLGNDDATLLAINFSSFTTDGGNFKEIEGLEIAGANIADSDKQLLVDKSVIKTANKNENFSDEFQDVPRKNKDEKSFIDGSDVYVYVPEEVCEDLDELVGKTITVILGKNNIAELIIVEDDIVGDDYLTAYNSTKGKITIGGTKYTLSDKGYKVTLNGTDIKVPATLCEDCDVLGPNPDCPGTHGYVAPTKIANLADALTNLLSIPSTDFDEIEKRIEATVTLDGEDEVKTIDLVASKTITNISREALVLKAKEKSSVYEIKTTDGTFTWDLEEEAEDEIDFPKVYVDGVKGEMRDIEAGNVITVLTTESSLASINVENIEKIYVSTKTAVGTPEKITKSDNAVKVDGTYYNPTDARTSIVTDEELSKVSSWETFVPNTILDNDQVTLYLNMFDEYVYISLEEVASDYTFGVVTFVATTMSTSGDEEEYQEAKFRVLLPNGTKAYYTLSLDTSDEDLMDTVNDADVLELLPTKGNFVMFEANADKVVTVENATPFKEIVAFNDQNNQDPADDAFEASATTIPNTDYVVAVLNGAIDEGEFMAVSNVEAAETTFDSSAKYYKLNGDDVYELQTVTEGTYNNGTDLFTLTKFDAEYDKNETVIFNLEDKKIVSKWEAILNPTEDDFKVAAQTFAIFEDEDADVPMFIVTNCTYTDSDAVYALAGEEAVNHVGDKTYADLVGTDGIEFSSVDGTIKDVVTGWLVEYAMSSDKISKAFSIINVDKFYNVDTKKNEATVDDIVDFDTDRDLVAANNQIPGTQLAAGFSVSNKLEAIALSNIKTRTEKYKLEFVEIDDVAIDSITVSDDVVVYELSKTGVVEVDIVDIQAEVAEGETIYAIPCKDAANEDVVFILR